MEWISVKDKLPYEGKYVLVWDGNFLREDGSPCYEIAAYRSFANGDRFMYGPYSLQGITYWMPLPKVPNDKSFEASQNTCKGTKNFKNEANPPYDYVDDFLANNYTT